MVMRNNVCSFFAAIAWLVYKLIKARWLIELQKESKGNEKKKRLSRMQEPYIPTDFLPADLNSAFSCSNLQICKLLRDFYAPAAAYRVFLEIWGKSLSSIFAWYTRVLKCSRLTTCQHKAISPSNIFAPSLSLLLFALIGLRTPTERSVNKYQASLQILALFTGLLTLKRGNCISILSHFFFFTFPLFSRFFLK